VLGEVASEALALCVCLAILPNTGYAMLFSQLINI